MSLKLPSYRKHVLPNGLTVLSMPRRGLPLVNFQFLLNAGGMADPAGREGLAAITAEALRKGSRSCSAKEFAAALDSLGGVFMTHCNVEETGFAAEFLSKDYRTGLALLQQALREPIFPEEEIRKVTLQRSDGLRQAKDNPAAVIQAYFDGFLFEGHPYGRPVSGTEETAVAVSRDEVTDFWQREYLPNRTILAAVGDFREEELLRHAEALFGDWPRRDFEPPPVPAFHPPAGRRVLLVDKPDATQAYFRIGGPGIKRCHPAFVEVQVLNTVFGGRFTSWLSSALRINSGLTYSARSFFASFRRYGSFAIASYTPTATTERALDLSLEQLERLHNEGISGEELESVKKYIRGQFPPTLETGDQLAALIADLESHDLNASYVDTYLDRVDGLQAAEARRLIAECFPREELTFVLIGAAEFLEKALPRYGRLTRCSISDPGFFGPQRGKRRNLLLPHP